MTWSVVSQALASHIGVAEGAAVIMLGVIAAFGFVLRAARVDGRLLTPPAPVNAPWMRSRWDRPVPAPVLGGTMLIGLVAVSIVGCYAYYPGPQEALEEIRLARVETLSGASSGDAEHALHWLPVWEEWSRRLEVGVFIRHGTVRPYQRMQGYIIRKKLELLEHELEHSPLEPEEIKAVLKGIYVSDRRWREAFRG